jgi:hypothetical protein
MCRIVNLLTSTRFDELPAVRIVEPPVFHVIVHALTPDDAPACPEPELLVL